MEPPVLAAPRIDFPRHVAKFLDEFTVPIEQEWAVELRYSHDSHDSDVSVAFHPHDSVWVYNRLPVVGCP